MALWADQEEVVLPPGKMKFQGLWDLTDEEKERFAAQMQTDMPYIRKAIFDVKGFQSGGKIPGYGGGDTVPILAEKGEYIINKQSASRYHSVLEAINNKGIQGFQSGGLVYAQGGFNFGQSYVQAQSDIFRLVFSESLCKINT
jgi:hypothetical protein